MDGSLVDDAERDLLIATVAQGLASRRGGDGYDVLVELGWHDMLAAEPHTATAVVFDALGRANVRSSCLADVIATALGHEPGVAVMLPAYGTAVAPGVRGAAEGRQVIVAGLALASTVGAPTVLVACTDGQAVLVRTTDLRLEAVSGIDPSLGLRVVSGRAEPVGEPAPAPWSAAVDIARVALGHEITGACRTMLDLACDHARGRMQFGRSIASFQAVRHKLAEVLVAVEAAEAALDAAHHTPSPVTAALAKVLAGRAASAAAVHCQQVLAGIGFTREHELHRFLLRTIALDGLFGSARSLTRELGAGLLADRTVPRVIDL